MAKDTNHVQEKKSQATVAEQVNLGRKSLERIVVSYNAAFQAASARDESNAATPPASEDPSQRK